MPLYVMIGRDAPDRGELRQSHRPAHLEALEALVRSGQLHQAGPMLDAQGAPVGSVVFFEAESLEAAQALAAQDPYVIEGIFESHEVHETRITLPAP